MGTLEFGAEQAVKNCVKVKAGEQVVIITDHSRKQIAQAIQAEVQKITPNIDFFIMEDFGPRPADGKNPLPFPDEIKKVLEKAQVSFFMAGARAGELESFRHPMSQLAKKFKIRHAHMIHITEEIMKEGMAVDYSKVQQLTNKLFEILAPAKEIRVTAARGTDAVFYTDPAAVWVPMGGDIKPDCWENLPSGEVFTAPASADGQIVVDGCLGDYLVGKYGLIEATPLYYELKGGWIVKGSIKCENKELEEEIKQYLLNSGENADRVGELGIGTNVGITKLIGNMLQDEKIPGVHVALGDSLSSFTKSTWSCKTHLDGVIQRTTIVVDGTTIMKEGKFTI